MRKHVVSFVVAAMMMWPTSVLCDSNVTPGDVAWHVEHAGNTVASISRSTSNETIDYHIWTDTAFVYQHFRMTSFGYNGVLVRMQCREIRPGQVAADAAENEGMRDPEVLFRAMRVEFGAQLIDADTGVVTIIEVRQAGANYLLVVTEFVPPNRKAPPPTAM